MLIICCGMPRSGSTWQYQIASELVEIFGAGHRIGFLPAEAYLKSAFASAGAKETVVLKCHDYHPYFGRLCQDGLAKTIYSFRDIREVVLSIAWKLGISVSETIHSDALQHAIDSYYLWTATPNILIQRYEVFTSQPQKAIYEIAAYIGLTISESETNELDQRFSKDANRIYVDKFKSSLLAEGVEPEKDYLMYDQHSLLHWNHIRPRSAIRWQDLSSEELKEMSLIIQQWLVDTGIERNSDWIFSSVSEKKE